VSAETLGDGDLIVTPIGALGWLIGSGSVPDPWSASTSWMAWIDPDDADALYVLWEAVPTDQMIAAAHSGCVMWPRHTILRDCTDLRSNGVGFLIEHEVFRPQG